MKYLLVIPGLLLFLSVSILPQAAPETLAQTSENFIRSDRLGLAHISSATTEPSETRYRRALLLGAGWNRWPIYWNSVEAEPGVWDWTSYDRQVAADLNHRLQINAILLGRPEFYASGGSIQGLQLPIFADGTDTPGEGKTFNPDNPWPRFVYEAVMRYKPGGALSREGLLPLGAGIRVWEVWNEPDHQPFWRGGIPNYARLLKVAYIAAKMADPNAQIMFGGLLFPTDVNWLAQVLNIFINDPLREQYNWYMDIVAIHSYTYPWRSGWLALVARQTLVAYGIDRPIWLNETGVPVWDDYPGPIWAPDSLRRATSQQQAWYFIQSAAYAWSQGVDKIFFHQLYDDCGDQPAGTDFPPHNGDLCVGDVPCFGDAHGIYRNTRDSICFSQHPFPDTPRPVARAFRLVAEIFGTQAFGSGEQRFIDDRAVTITFERPLTNERITVLWNRRLEPFTLQLPASGENGQLISLDSNAVITPDARGNYLIALPPAQPDNYPAPEPGDAAGIGGPPFILIERADDAVELVQTDLDEFDSPQAATSAAPRPTPRPTTDPAFDTEPPQASVFPLPPFSEPTFRVSWGGRDNSGIDRYLIWVRVDGGNWQPWLETALTGADYTGTPGSTYEFAAWAVDLAGNWSSNTDLHPQAVTQVE